MFASFDARATKFFRRTEARHGQPRSPCDEGVGRVLVGCWLGVAPVLLRCCYGIASVLFRCASLAQPLHNPCTTLVQPLCRIRVSGAAWTPKATKKQGVTHVFSRLSAAGDANSTIGSNPAPAVCGSYFLGVVAGAGVGGRVLGRFVSSTGGIAIPRPFVPGTLACLVSGFCGEVSGLDGACPGIAGAAESGAAFCRPASKALVVRV